LHLSPDELLSQLETIRDLVINEHQSLYLDDINELINKVRLFGFYFATLDIRQNSKIHDSVIKELAPVLPAPI
jgi:phosphoenolpyruvate carboxylase